MAKSLPLVEQGTIKPLIHLMRGQRVILDTDLAAIYGVSTIQLKEGARKYTVRNGA